MIRKPIQLMVNRNTDMIVLCDDGTIWGFSYEKMQWFRCPDIPADDPPRRLAGGFPEGEADRGRN